MYMSLELIGYIAAFCTTISFVPQALKTIHSKKTKDISLPMYLILSAGLILWTSYGIFIHNISIIAANGITFLFVLPILILKMRHG